MAPPGGDERFYFLAMPEGEVYFLAERREGEMGKLVVYKGKGLVENGREGEMEITEFRLLDLILGKINQTEEIDPNAIYEINISDYAERFDLESGQAYRDVKDKFDKLMGKYYTIPEKLINEDAAPEDMVKSHWLQSIFYNDKEQTLSVQFTETTGKLVSNITSSGGFLKFDLENKKYLSSAYHSKLYEILKNQAFKKSWRVPVEKVKENLGLVGKYKNFGQFRESILEPALEMINSTTDLSVTWIGDKKGGNKVLDLVFELRSQKI